MIESLRMYFHYSFLFTQKIHYTNRILLLGSFIIILLGEPFIIIRLYDRWVIAIKFRRISDGIHCSAVVR